MNSNSIKAISQLSNQLIFCRHARQLNTIRKPKNII